MRTWLCVGLLLISATLRADSDPQLVREFLQVSGVKANLAKSFDVFKQRVQAQMEQNQQAFDSKLKFDQNETVREIKQRYLNQAAEQAAQILSWEVLEKDLVRTYGAALSDKDLKALIDFYSSKVGRKYLAQEARIQNQISALVQQRVQQISPAMRELFNQFTTELSAEIKRQQSDKQPQAE